MKEYFGTFDCKNGTKSKDLRFAWDDKQRCKDCKTGYKLNKKKICSDCQPTHYKSGDKCIKISECTIDEYEKAPPTKTSDRKCLKIYIKKETKNICRPNVFQNDYKEFKMNVSKKDKVTDCALRISKDKECSGFFVADSKKCYCLKNESVFPNCNRIIESKDKDLYKLSNKYVKPTQPPIKFELVKTNTLFESPDSTKTYKDVKSLEDCAALIHHNSRCGKLFSYSENNRCICKLKEIKKPLTRDGLQYSMYKLL